MLNSVVKGRDYAYHAWLPPDRPLIRYDNAERHGGFHRHVFNVLTGEELVSEPLTHDDLPTLDQIVREAVALGMLAAF